MLAEGTVEDRIAALLAPKRELADAVVGSGEAWISELSDDDLDRRSSQLGARLRPAAHAHARRATFGATWWGQAWVDALEHRARLDPNRLPRGRTYARRTRVGG